jgi:hypothetical protein
VRKTLILNTRKSNGPLSTTVIKKTKKITKLFKETQMKVAFRARNTIQNVDKPHPQIDKYEKKRHLPNEMHGLPTKTRTANGPNILHQI